MTTRASTVAVPSQSAGGNGMRIRAFANFFKSYMSVSTIVAAAIPIPVASLKLIPAYAQQRGYLTVYSSLLCFLLLAFLFSIRHRLSVWMFAHRRQSRVLLVVPLVLIALTVGSICGYHIMLQRSLDQFRALGVAANSSEILAAADYSEIPFAAWLSVLYLGIFIFAEAAFVLMALREYLQDVLCLDEVTMLKGSAGFRRLRGYPKYSGPSASPQDEGEGMGGDEEGSG